MGSFTHHVIAGRRRRVRNAEARDLGFRMRRQRNRTPPSRMVAARLWRDRPLRYWQFLDNVIERGRAGGRFDERAGWVSVCGGRGAGRAV